MPSGKHSVSYWKDMYVYTCVLVLEGLHVCMYDSLSLRGDLVVIVTGVMHGIFCHCEISLGP